VAIAISRPSANHSNAFLNMIELGASIAKL
jgi:hypothetical protein